ncbi:polysaccharide pyruvyl transferase CsaB [Candidatus Synechococcus spongiarum]|nr:polysaccharide pyruvyl transferase CsaB [Candidatus Synechococcus spongiarum]MCY4360509.1 polysaccharide pyruvyl transferase CsaB [Cyanobacteria bacterium MAG APA_bin_95]
MDAYGLAWKDFGVHGAMGDGARRRPGSIFGVLLCGYYGEHNLGDDALLATLLALLPPSCRVVATARDQHQVREQFGVATCPRGEPVRLLLALMRVQVLVLGGGSLLQDSTSRRSLLYYVALILAARLLGRTVLLWGQGLGPLNARTSRFLARLSLQLVQGITWRDEPSAAMAAAWGIHAPVGRDPVWSLPRRNANSVDGPPAGAVCLCWRPTPLLSAAGWRQLENQVIEDAKRHQAPVCLVPFHVRQDAALLQGCAARLQAVGLTCRVWHPRTPWHFMEGLASVGLVVAMRLHAVILAAMADRPLLALCYDPKVNAAATAMAVPSIDLADPDGLAALPAAWEQARRWRRSPARLAQHLQRNRCHQELLATVSR